MSKRYFVTKIINLILTAVILLTYQAVASGRADKEKQALENASQQKTEQGAPVRSAYKDGSFTGKAEGYGGDVEMTVVIKDGKMNEIKTVSASGEDESYWDMAREVIPKIIERQSPDVDTVSGATYSSTGIINAVTLALRQAAN